MARRNDQEKWALLIGINRYTHLPPYNQLEGCVNDVEAMGQLLQKSFGFRADHVAILRNEEASRTAILKALDSLTKQVGEDDVVVIHYSGHGSAIRDREGDEPDGWDETIVPSDSGRDPHPNRDISDDEIYERLLAFGERTPHVALIFDSCHSGSIARDAFGTKSRWVAPDDRPVDVLPPSFVATKTIEALKESKASSRELAPSGWLPPAQRHVLIAGCRDDESSYEHRASGGAVVHGALTYFFLQELAKAGKGSTYRDVFERACAQVTARYPRQHPQMEGTTDCELFGVHDITPLRFVPVDQRSGARVTIAAGAAHGVMAGARWSVYPAGTKQVSPQMRRLGSLEITAVGSVTAEGTVLEEERPGAIAAGARAVEEAHAYGEMRVAVDVRAAEGREGTVATLDQVIEESGLLRRAAPGETADACIYLLEPRAVVRPDAPVPQLGNVDEVTWAVVGTDGRLVMPPHRLSEPDAPAALCENLERIARYRQALALCNPDIDSLLRGKVDVMLKRRAPGGAWAEATPQAAGGQVAFTEGDAIALEITNRHTDPVYISVLDFGLTSRIALVHPAGPSELLAPGQTMKVGERTGGEIELFMPEDFPYASDPTDEAPAGGIETLKVITTTQPADFHWVEQPGVRGGTAGRDTAVEQLLAMALTGWGTREARLNHPETGDDWTTVDRTLYLRRRS